MEDLVVFCIMLQIIISGGQTGADRAALDVAIEFDVPHGGWIPKGRKTEDGSPLPKTVDETDEHLVSDNDEGA